MIRLLDALVGRLIEPHKDQIDVEVSAVLIAQHIERVQVEVRAADHRNAGDLVLVAERFEVRARVDARCRVRAAWSAVPHVAGRRAVDRHREAASIDAIPDKRVIAVLVHLVFTGRIVDRDPGSPAAVCGAGNCLPNGDDLPATFAVLDRIDHRLLSVLVHFVTVHDHRAFDVTGAVPGRGDRNHGREVLRHTFLVTVRPCDIDIVRTDVRAEVVLVVMKRAPAGDAQPTGYLKIRPGFHDVRVLAGFVAHP